MYFYSCSFMLTSKLQRCYIKCGYFLIIFSWLSLCQQSSIGLATLFFCRFFLFFFLSLSPSKHPILLYCLYFVFPYENSLNSLVYFTIFIAIIFIVFVCLYYFIKNFSYIFCFRFILCVCLKFCAATPTFAILFLQWSILRALWYVRSLLWCCHSTNKRTTTTTKKSRAVAIDLMFIDFILPTAFFLWPRTLNFAVICHFCIEIQFFCFLLSFGIKMLLLLHFPLSLYCYELFLFLF